MNEILKRISEKKAKLDALRPLPTELEKNLYDWFKVAFTHSSIAIEGNTLTLAETAQVVEKQITINGKSITEHLEALNHAQAVDYIAYMSTTKSRKQVTVHDVLAIQHTVLKKINDQAAGRFRTTSVQVSGSPVATPNHLKVPALMNELMFTITTSQGHIATIAAQAHVQLAEIHPFVDGNGRTARLLMNLLLLQQGYPLVIIDVKDRKEYIEVIQKALVGQREGYYTFIYAAIERSLDEYLKAASESRLIA